MKLKKQIEHLTEPRLLNVIQKGNLIKVPK